MEPAKVVPGNEEWMHNWMVTTGEAEAIVAREGGQTLQGTQEKLVIMPVTCIGATEGTGGGRVADHSGRQGCHKWGK
jgi:hypothetical protein